MRKAQTYALQRVHMGPLRKLSVGKQAYLLCVLCAAMTVSSPATTTFTSLVTFDGKDGQLPWNAPLAQGLDGNFYGTTNAGGGSGCGDYGCGTVFKITPSGILATLYKFCSQTNCADGDAPYAGLVLASDGNFYGTTEGGGVRGLYGGTVFRITPAGELTTIYKFCSLANCNDGWGPLAGLVQGTDGDLYGTASHAGPNGGGTVFKITPEGTLTTLYSFCAQADCSDGNGPAAVLVQGTDGNFYGTTEVGGTLGNGTVFKITPEGSLTTLYRFTGSDGSEPAGGLIQARDGNFYGLTGSGGIYGRGTVFKITSEGRLTTLYSFCRKPNCTDGLGPQYTQLIQAIDGNFYGTTFQGGTHNSSLCLGGGCGTVFEITPTGTLTTLTTLYSFCALADCADGFLPNAGLVQATDGKIYGTTFGNLFTPSCTGSGCGTVFRLSLGLNHFVETVPTSGRVGTAVMILGNNLNGTTEVRFNGTMTTFTVISGTEIEAIVPSGATTGFVTVTTPTGTLTSNQKFLIL
jgi:uncharacterized repeat protein (TIGR03803 family)